MGKARYNFTSDMINIPPLPVNKVQKYVLPLSNNSCCTDITFSDTKCNYYYGTEVALQYSIVIDLNKYLNGNMKYFCCTWPDILQRAVTNDKHF